MKRIKYVFIVCFSILAFSSCEDVVQVKLDQGAKLYIIDAFLTNQNQMQTVEVTESDNYFSNQEAPPVSRAQVLLKDLNNNTVYTFSYSGKGKYSYDATTQAPFDGLDHAYELNVTIDGVTYISTSKQKRTAGIDSISAIYMEGGGGFGPTEPFYNCFLWAKDKVDEDADYYWIKTYRNDTLFGEPGELNVAIDGTGGPVYEPGVDSLAFTPPGIFLGFATFQSGDSCKVEVHSISREAYNFLVQAISQILNGGLFATTPENVRTNIVTPSGAETRAIGWFNIARVATKSRLIPL